MRPIKNTCILYLTVFLFSLIIFSCTNRNKSFNNYSEKIADNIGEHFPIKNYVDTSKRNVTPNFSRSDITIVDFWIDDCAPCNAEMTQFKELLKGREKQVSIVSVSLSNFNIWKSLFTSQKNVYSFLDASLPNWEQLTLASNDDNTLNDRLEEVSTKLNVTFFPSYFVLNKKGEIIARPESAVQYIKENIN